MDGLVETVEAMEKTETLVVVSDGGC